MKAIFAAIVLAATTASAQYWGVPGQMWVPAQTGYGYATMARPQDVVYPSYGYGYGYGYRGYGRTYRYYGPSYFPPQRVRVPGHGVLIREDW